MKDRSRTRVFNVLLVDDDPGVLESLGHALSTRGARVTTVTTLDEARASLGTETIELVLTDLRLDGPRDGLEVARIARSECPNARIVLISGHDLGEVAEDAEQAGVDEMLAKPLPIAVLDRLLEDLGVEHPTAPPLAGRPRRRLTDDEGQLLLDAWIAGDDHAFELLTEAYRPMLFSVFLRWFRLEAEDAEDLFQEVMLQLVRKGAEIRSVRMWLLGTGINQAKKRIRRLIRERRLAELYTEEIDLQVDEEPDGVAEFVRRGLSLLKPSDRALLSLIYLEELSYQDTAERLGRPIGSIGPLRGRALKRLSTALTALDTPPELDNQAA